MARSKEEIQSILEIVDSWLNSDETFVTDKDGKRIEGGLIDCKKCSLLNRLLKDE